jgi:RNA polymerase sigma factor (sigma-70 family)
MPFPATRYTLIQRWSQGGGEDDWQTFLRDYWGAVCRFSQRTGNLTFDDAEDITAEVFEAILQGQLLRRWSEVRTAKLRTLICAVARNILSNHFRTNAGRTRLVLEHGGQLNRYQSEQPPSGDEATPEQADAFCVAWADNLIQTAIEGLLREYTNANRADYFRVLYGRICEDLSMAEIADALQIAVSSADNYLRHARRRLSERLEELVLAHVRRYSRPEDVEHEFQVEWNQLKESLQYRGGLEKAVRDVCAGEQQLYRHHW